VSNHLAGSVIRPILHSAVLISKCQFDRNQVLGTVVAVESNVTMTETYFYQNMAIGGDLLLYQASHVQLIDSCFEELQDAFTSVFVDGTSTLIRSNNYGVHGHGDRTAVPTSLPGRRWNFV
jgi:hypothetical protein